MATTINGGGSPEASINAPNNKDTPSCPKIVYTKAVKRFFIVSILTILQHGVSNAGSLDELLGEPLTGSAKRLYQERLACLR